MSSGLVGSSGVPAGSLNATLGLSAGNDTASLSTFVSATSSTFTSNSTVIEVLPTPSLATTLLSTAISTVSTTAAPVRATLVKATSGPSFPAPTTPTPSSPSSTVIMGSSSSQSAAASTTAKIVASDAVSTGSKAPASSVTAAAPSSQASVTPSPSPSSRIAPSSLSSPDASPSSSSTQRAGAQAPASSSSAIKNATSSAAGTVSSSSAGEKSGPLSAAPSPASSSPASFPAPSSAPSSGSIVPSTSSSNKPLSSGSAIITSGPSNSQAKSEPSVVDLPATTSISTVTEAPQTTFATPVSIAVTASDGHTTLSAPPLVTSVLPSTRTDGMVVQVTHVIANPNSNLNALDKHSFFDNAGAVAGTFVAVGIVATALAALLLCCIRRRRRAARRARLEARLPAFPFQDEPATRQTAERRSISIVPMDMDDPFAEPARTRPPLLFRSVGSADGHSAQAEGPGHAYEGPFADYQSPEHGAFGHHDAIEAARAPSRAVSTPSIYPPSLSEDGRDRDSLYEQEVHVSPPLRSYPTTSVPEYIPLERRNSTRPSTQESNQLRELDAYHPPLLARPPPMLHTPSYGYATSSTDHGSSTDGPQTPRSECATAVGSVYSGDEKERVGTFSGLQRPASPQSVFLRRQLSKPLAESFSIPAELRRMSVVANDPRDFMAQ